MLGNTPLGSRVGTVGDLGTGLLDNLGGIGNAGSGLGLGPILKPVKAIAGGLPLVGPTAGGLIDTVGGVNLAQQSVNGLPIVGPLAGGVLDKFSGLNMVQQSSITPSPPLGMLTQTAYPAAQLEETIVGRLEDGRLVTNTGRVINPVALGGNTGGSPFASLPTNPTTGLGGGIPGLGRLPETVMPSDLGKVVASLPPGLGQILQPVGGAEKYLQIGNRLIPLGAADGTQLSQLGLDRLPVTPVGAGFGYPNINYLQDGQTPEPVDGDAQGEESKEVKANPVTTWMNGGNATLPDSSASNSTLPDTNANGTSPWTSDSGDTPVTDPSYNISSGGTYPDADANEPMPLAYGGSNMMDTGNDTMPLSTKSHIPANQLEVQPLELAPPAMYSAGHQTAAGKPHSMIKGDDDPWYEVDIDGGDTFKRIAAEMSGGEKNYYNGSERDPDNGTGIIPDGHTAKDRGHHNDSLRASDDLGGGAVKPVFDGDKGRVGWQEINGTPSSSAYDWQSTSTSASANVSATPMPTPTPPVSSDYAGPTGQPHDESGTYVWSEDWGDWVSAGMGDTDLHVGWDDTTFASATVSSPRPTSTHMGTHASAGLS